MIDEKMPVVFVGHGSPMNAIGNNRARRGWREVGKRIGKPAAILGISAHWTARGKVPVRTDPLNPQIMDMYGFPEELYQVQYQPMGDNATALRALELLGHAGKADNEWGLDHGLWSVLNTMYPDADVPVVPMGVDMSASDDEHYDMGRRLSALRDEGVLIVASGNIVHNLGMTDWNNPNGTDWADQFDQSIFDAVQNSEFEKAVHYEQIPSAKLAVPTRDHYLPFLVALGAVQVGDRIGTFNNYRELGSMSMTSYLFEPSGE